MLFDGQHKSAAQIWAGRKALDCKVYVDPDIRLLKDTNLIAHDKLRQMAFFTSTLIAKYSDIFKQEWEEYLERPGEKNESDFVVFLRNRGKTTTEAKKMLMSAIENDVIDDPANRLAEFIAERNRTRKSPVSISILQKTFFKEFILPPPTTMEFEGPDDCRAQEKDNLVRLLSVIADKQLPQGDWPMPVAPGEWHYRQSIDYEITQNRAIVDLASRYRETWLFNIWRMGTNSIQNGSGDHWTVTPKRIAALEAAAASASPAAAAGAGRGGRGGRGGAATAPTAAASGGDVPAGGGSFGGSARAIPAELYNSILRDPKMRDPRGYIVPSNQADFATATQFVNALLKTGIAIDRATAAFQVAGKSYPAGSYVVKTAQAFRPHVMDMFEPQDHPNDFAYPGGPPKRPYDSTGWTLAMQMGVQFDRVMEGFDGPFTRINGLLPAPAMSVVGPPNPAGYLISHRINNSFVLINRLMKVNADVYWLKSAGAADGEDLGTGAIWVPASAAVRPVLEKSARDLGVTVHAVAKAPAGDAMKLKPIRIGLYDQYGGSMPSGWTRWLFEQYEFPFEVVYPAALDAGDLKSKFDVIVFTDGAIRRGAAGGRGGGGGGFGGAPDPATIPAEYQNMLGRISDDKTMPQLKKFVESGGSIVTIGSSTSIAEVFGIPVKNHLVEKGADGRDRALPGEKFYIPGSLL
ncbi:MAG: hypothetical protein NTW28_22495, partial [Candidatus Solibacter sp.]|nr:hypothetical protein [Candidatus Solibacter sp.]